MQSRESLRETLDEHDREARIQQRGGCLKQEPPKPSNSGTLEARIASLIE